VVRLLERTLIRVGNREYARENRSFGLTTLRNRHARVRGGSLQFHFRGKSGQEHRVGINDRRLARVVRRCQELPGQELFQYLDEKGERRAVTSEDVNAYLRDLTGEEFSAKDFRTWAGSVLAARLLADLPPVASDAEARRAIAETIKQVAARLGNTPAVCRACYVHPAVQDAFMDGTLGRSFDSVRRRGDGRARLEPDEGAFLNLLRRETRATPGAPPRRRRARGSEPLQARPRSVA
jgi:DNA topoisomerase-1